MKNKFHDYKLKIDKNASEKLILIYHEIEVHFKEAYCSTIVAVVYKFFSFQFFVSMLY